MIKRYRRWRDRNKRRRTVMQHQKLTNITRGLQAAAAETNALVADQYIRILSEYFDHHEDGTLEAKMVRVQLDDKFYSNVPLVSLVAPSGLGLDKMRVQLSIKLEEAREERVNLLSRLRGSKSGEQDEVSRSDFQVSFSPRTSGEGKERPSDHVHIDLEFKSLPTPESISRVIETYTNMIAPIPIPPEDGKPAPDPEAPKPDAEKTAPTDQDKEQDEGTTGKASDGPETPET
jgi:hypothetical protein